MITTPTEQDLRHIEEATSFEVLAQIAYEMIIDQLVDPACMVWGLLTIRSKSVNEDTGKIIVAGRMLSAKGYDIFDQTVFGKSFERLAKITGISHPDTYRQTILKNFYLPLFRSRAIKALCFLPGRDRSIAVLQKLQRAQKLDIEIFLLPRNWRQNRLNVYFPLWMEEPSLQ